MSLNIKKTSQISFLCLLFSLILATFSMAEPPDFLFENNMHNVPVLRRDLKVPVGIIDQTIHHAVLTRKTALSEISALISQKRQELGLPSEIPLEHQSLFLSNHSWQTIREHSVPSPIPGGKIVRLFIHKDQEVKKGDRCCIVEAMKMEMSIRAPKAGTISHLFFKEGEIVCSSSELVLFNLFPLPPEWIDLDPSDLRESLLPFFPWAKELASTPVTEGNDSQEPDESLRWIPPQTRSDAPALSKTPFKDSSVKLEESLSSQEQDKVDTSDSDVTRTQPDKHPDIPSNPPLPSTPPVKKQHIEEVVAPSTQNMTPQKSSVKPDESLRWIPPQTPSEQYKIDTPKSGVMLRQSPSHSHMHLELPSQPLKKQYMEELVTSSHQKAKHKGALQGVQSSKISSSVPWVSGLLLLALFFWIRLRKPLYIPPYHVQTFLVYKDPDNFNFPLSFKKAI